MKNNERQYRKNLFFVFYIIYHTINYTIDLMIDKSEGNPDLRNLENKYYSEFWRHSLLSKILYMCLTE